MTFAATFNYFNYLSREMQPKVSLTSGLAQSVGRLTPER